MAGTQYNRKSLIDDETKASSKPPHEIQQAIPKYLPSLLDMSKEMPFPKLLNTPSLMFPVPVQFNGKEAVLLPMPSGFTIAGEGAQAIYSNMLQYLQPAHPEFDISKSVPKKK